jgi:hypothetical protein
MFGFGKKKDKPLKPRKSSGINHGLRFQQNETSWTIDLDGKSNILIAGSGRIDAARSVMKALEALDEDMIILSNDDLLNPDGDKLTIDNGADRLRSIIVSSISGKIMNPSDPKSTDDDHPSGTIILEGWEQLLTEGEYTPTEPSLADGSYERAVEIVSPIIGDDAAGKTVKFIDSRSEDDAAKTATILALTILHEKALGESGLTIESIRSSFDDDLAYAVCILVSQGQDEDVYAFTDRLRRDPITMKAAPMFLAAGSDLGLMISPAGPPVVIEKISQIIKNGYDPMEGTTADAHAFMAYLKTLLAISGESGPRVILVSDGKIAHLNGVVQLMQSRIISGSLDASQRWIAGSDDERAPIDPRDGVMTVFSSFVGRFGLTSYSAISPEFMVDRTMITLV